MEQSIYQSYVAQIRKYDLLTAEQEHDLARRVHHGDSEARTALVKSNLRLVAALAKKYSSPRINIMDLIQEGNLGLMTAASKYTSDFNTRFSTYAYAWILQYILRYIRNKSNAISLPHRKEEQIRALRAAKSYLEQRSGTSVSIESLACYMGMSVELVKKLSEYAQPMCSLDVECNTEGNSTIGDMISDERYQPEDLFLTKERKESVHQLVDRLAPREKEVISRRYSFVSCGEAHTLRELSKVMGVSSETVRQIEIRAVKKLRNFVENSSTKALFQA